MDDQGKKNFYNVLRTNHINLTNQNVFGMEKILAYAEQRKTPLQSLKYIMGTAFWESGGSMTPVEEGYYLGSKAKAFQKKLRYYPWYGRGLVQTTFEENYRKIWHAIGREGDPDPDAFLTWEVALPALFDGMEQGLYTGKKVSDYIDLVDEDDVEDLREMTQARRVVNLMDQAKTIANLGLKFERALKAGGYPY